MRTWSASSCPSSSGAACSGPATAGQRCASTWGSGAPRPHTVAEPRRPLRGHPGDRRRHAGRGTDGGHGAGRVRRRRHQGRAAGRRRPLAHLGRSQGRHRPLLEEHEPQQALCHARPQSPRRPGGVPPVARRQRRGRREQPPQRPGQVVPRLRVGARGPSPPRDAPCQRLRPRRPRQRPPGVRHPGRGHERVRPCHRTAGRPPDAPTLLPGRRRRGPIRHLRGDDGAVPPRPPWRRRPAG